RQTIIATE
nr:zona pellucida-binding protein, AWN-1=T1 fragment [swine, sperm, Peptide Partial, 8 aa] [Sus scrofa]